MESGEEVSPGRPKAHSNGAVVRSNGSAPGTPGSLFLSRARERLRLTVNRRQAVDGDDGRIGDEGAGINGFSRQGTTATMTTELVSASP